MLPLLAVEVADALEGEIQYVQGAAAWLTVKLCPAMVNAPVRGAVLVLTASE
jgi:hypothetical protein